MSQRLRIRRSDQLLDALERCALQRKRPPEHLRTLLASLADEVGFGAPLPHSAVRCHDWLFRLQAQLLQTSDTDEEEEEVPSSELPVWHGWARLLLPRPVTPWQPEWVELAEATVDRAFERWLRAQHHAKKCAKRKRGTRHALRRVRAAWDDYYELQTVLEKVLSTTFDMAVAA